MTLTDSNLRYLLAIHHLALQSTEVSPLALAQAMGVTKPSVTSILTSLMKQGVIVRRRYGKIYITDRGVLYARYYDELVEKIFAALPAPRRYGWQSPARQSITPHTKSAGSYRREN